MAFETKILGNNGFEKLQASTGLGLHLVPIWKGSILYLIDPYRFLQASSLKHMSVRGKRHDKDYLGEDMCFPHVKGFHEGGIPYHKTDPPYMKYQRTYGDFPWVECSWELA
jgi:hypothetical protein